MSNLWQGRGGRDAPHEAARRIARLHGPTDPLTHLTVVATLLTTAVVATVLPARRAMRLDLVRVLQSE